MRKELRSDERARRLHVWLVAPLLLTLACEGGGSNPMMPDRSSCGPWPSQESSPYVLPYPVGAAYTVSQGNCTSATHVLGTRDQYAYDFSMPIGSSVTAAARGVVGELEERFADGNGVVTESNYVLIRHADGTSSVYFHLTQNGVLVGLGQTVEAGQNIGLSGQTGGNGTIRPHLHFGVLGGSGVTIPVTFRNTSSHPNGLQPGVAYLALAFSNLQSGGAPSSQSGGAALLPLPRFRLPELDNAAGEGPRRERPSCPPRREREDGRR